MPLKTCYLCVMNYLLKKKNKKISPNSTEEIFGRFKLYMSNLK